MTSPARLQLDIVGDLAGMATLRPDWEMLESRVPEATGFQSFHWCHLWLVSSQEIAPGRVRPRVVIVRDGCRVVMIWPLETVRWCGLNLVRWIGEPMTQYGDALAEPGRDRSTWRAMVDDEIRRWRDVDLVVLSRIRADGVLAKGGSENGRLAGRTDADDIAPCIDVSSSSSAMRRIASDRSLRRRERRLTAIGPIAVETATDPDGRVAATRQCLAFKMEWLRRKRLFSVGLSHPVSPRFLERLARSGFLDAHVLRAGASTVAVELGFVRGATYRSFMSAYDLGHADGSPGHALTSRLVHRARDRGLQRFDLLAPADPYKLRWSDGQTALERSSYALTWRGRVGLWLLIRIRPLVKRWALLAGKAWPNREASVVPRPAQSVNHAPVNHAPVNHAPRNDASRPDAALEGSRKRPRPRTV